MPTSRVMKSGIGIAGVDERVEALADFEVRPEAHGADVDDAVALRVETCGLGVEDDELGRSGRGHGDRIAGGDRRGPSGVRPAGRPAIAPAATRMAAMRPRSSAWPSPAARPRVRVSAS